MASSNHLTLYFIIGVAAALVAVVLVVWLVPKPSYDYHGYAIQKGKCPGSNVTCWFVNFDERGQPYLMTFYYHPSQVENITVVPDALRVTELANLANSTLYITVPNNVPGEVGVAAIELTRVLGTRYNIANLNVKTAVYGTGPDQISCDNATGKTVIVSFEQGPDAVYIQSVNCIIVSASDAQRAVAVADAYTYRILGIIYTPRNVTQNRSATLPPIPITYTPPNSTNATNS